MCHQHSAGPALHDIATSRRDASYPQAFPQMWTNSAVRGAGGCGLDRAGAALRLCYCAAAMPSVNPPAIPRRCPKEYQASEADLSAEYAKA